MTNDKHMLARIWALEAIVGVMLANELSHKDERQVKALHGVTVAVMQTVKPDEALSDQDKADHFDVSESAIASIDRLFLVAATLAAKMKKAAGNE